jgi:predicted Zn-dependent peptidase
LDTILELDEIFARIDAVTPPDVQRLAQRLFQTEWLRLAVIGPHKDPARFDAMLHLE